MERMQPPAVLIALLLAATAFGQGMVLIEPPQDRPLLPRERRGRLELRRHQVDVVVRDQVATTTVEHVFYNPSGQRLEGQFLFPLPVGTHVDRVAMDVNGKDTEAELLDADKARSIYEDIVRRMRDPALLEYSDQDLIRARIFPIEPHSEKRITITCTALLTSDGGLIRYDYPLTGHRVEGRPVTRLAMRIDVETTRPLATIYSPSHEVQMTRKGDRRAVVGLETDQAVEGGVQLLFAPRPSDDNELALTLLTHRDPDEAAAGYFMLLATPAPMHNARPLPRTIVFVLDTSGSMAGEKIEQAKRALRFCVTNLNEGDRFQIIRFATNVEAVFNGLAPADGPHREQALAFLGDVKAVGGTAIHDALTAAQDATDGEGRVGAAYIVFLTDGQPTIGQVDPDAIVQAVAQRSEARVFCFGIGTDIHTKLLDRIAEQTRAATAYILPEEDLELKLSSFSGKIDQPALANPTVHVTGGEVTLNHFQPAALPDLFHGEQLVLFGRYRGTGQATLVLTGDRDGQQQAFERTVVFAAENGRSPFIPRMWATRRVGYLLDQIRLNGETDELRDEVVRLARRYAILTPYTSYLIVEDEAARNVPLPLQSLSGLRNQRRELSDSYALMREADTGRAGISANRANQQLRSASAITVAAPQEPVAGRPVPTPAARVVGGRAFVQNGQQWVDTNVQQMPDTRIRQIAFGSEDYFRLLHENPQAAVWVSVAPQVTFQLGSEIIQIVELD